MYIYNVLNKMPTKNETCCLECVCGSGRESSICKTNKQSHHAMAVISMIGVGWGDGLCVFLEIASSAKMRYPYV